MTRREDEPRQWAYLLIVGGLVLLAMQLGWLGWLSDWLWAAVFLAGGAAFAYQYRVDPQRWWELGALARVGSNGVVVGRQDAPTVARIKDAYDRIVAGYAVADGRVALPAHALLASAVR